MLFLLGISCSFTIVAQERFVSLEVSSLKLRLKNIPLNKDIKTMRFNKALTAKDSLSIIKIPLNDGTLKSFFVEESPIWIEANAMKTADIRTYAGISTDNDGYSIRFTVSPLGFSGIINHLGTYSVIEVVDKTKNQYKVHPLNANTRGVCEKSSSIIEPSIKEQIKTNSIQTIAPYPNGNTLRTYRLAAATTGQYTANIGGGNQNTALAKMTEIVNLLNAIYEHEVAIRFALTSATTSKKIIFTDSSTDPFTPKSDGGASAQASQDGFDLMALTTGDFRNFVPYNTYDVGHTFHYDSDNSSGSGQAGPTPCDNSYKASGWSQYGLNADIAAVVNTIAHEIGHQFGANHSYNARGGTSSTSTVCSDQWAADASIEPGSGTTIMSYAGLCSSPNYVIIEDTKAAYFHAKSIEQILQSDGFKNAGTSGCAMLTQTGNNLPSANAGRDITIPVNTPFILTGSATDADPQDILTYVWEQYDIATADDKGALGSTIKGKGGYYAVNSTSAPLFRSIPPSTSGNTRTFPNIKYVINNQNKGGANAGEDLPQVGRVMKFRLTVRDNKANGGAVDSDERIVTVSNTIGPFVVSYPNSGEAFNAGDALTVTWSVAGTNTLSPFVNIFLSIDGGNTFPIVLATNTTNDGEKQVNLPANIASSTNCRIKIISTSDLTMKFFDVSDYNFTINSSCKVTTSAICPTNSVTGQAGDAIFNLGLTNKNVEKVVNNTKNVSTANKVTRSVYCYSDNTYTTCTKATGFDNSSIIIPFRVSKSGNYEIKALSSSGNSKNFSVFTSTTIGCASFVGSASYLDTDGLLWSSDSKTLSLSECTDYYVVVYVGTSSTATIDLSILGVGDVLNTLVTPANVGYTYVAVKQSTNVISSISSTSNFTSLGAGTYNVYGLQYDNTVSPNTFLNQTVDQMYNSNNCVLLSMYSKILTITGNPCPTTLTLTSPADDITSGSYLKQASQTITATNTITGNATQATYKALNVILNSGFLSDFGTNFIIEPNGCGN